jgi:hypothetical protein
MRSSNNPAGSSSGYCGTNLPEDGLPQPASLLEVRRDRRLQLVHHREAAFDFLDDEALFFERWHGQRD